MGLRARSDGSPRNLTAWLAALAAIASVVLGVWQYTESRRNDRIEQRARAITAERNFYQQQICDSVNALNDAIVTILRSQANNPSPGENSLERALRFRHFEQEVQEARCVVEPVTGL